MLSPIAEYVLAGPVTYVDWDPEKVADFGTHLTPHNLIWDFLRLVIRVGGSGSPPP